MASIGLRTSAPAEDHSLDECTEQGNPGARYLGTSVIWIRPSQCNMSSSHCVELSRWAAGVAIRDSKRGADAPVLLLTDSPWLALLRYAQI